VVRPLSSALLPYHHNVAAIAVEMSKVKTTIKPFFIAGLPSGFPFLPLDYRFAFPSGQESAGQRDWLGAETSLDWGAKATGTNDTILLRTFPQD
jgi:hypothetical protein